MRIISGKFGSRRLKGTPPSGLRPTSDKLRETVFNILGVRVEGATFLDGCAGTGAIGLEAISRGAALVYFVEQSRKACRMIRENLQELDIQEGFKVFEMDIRKAFEIVGAVDIAFVDPPYDRDDLYEATLNHFNGDLLVLEHSKRKDLPEAAGRLRKIRSLVQGDAALAFYTPEMM
ncbi:MAG TPA: 16S rRNA (guanine(966)-N(2))-methyltransferase RsmD [Terriglobia bacterium]|jgi:16S rRNA (guanine(966)-N(2))-methyltransferase RsmD